ncbi:MAG: hypothetical protein M0017_00610 [Desulfobacteraceae bacterium]|nr:hypothetical protein [Desulfobacteraceae bacterium]
MPQQRPGLSAVLSIIAAIGSYAATFSKHPIIGLLAALAALPLGVIGLIMAASPRVRGGIVSIAAILLAIFALGIALLGIIGVILF